MGKEGGESGPVVAGICHLFLLGFGIEDGKVAGEICGGAEACAAESAPIIFG